MSQQSSVCSTCAAVIQAPYFCFCEGRETCLCEKCFLVHFSDKHGRVHFNLPASAYEECKIPGYFDRLHQRIINIPARRLELLKNLEAVDKCLTEFHFKIESIIQSIRDYADAKTDELNKLKASMEREIKAAIEEVDANLQFDRPVLVNKLSGDLIHFEKDSKSLKLFSYQIDESPIQTALDKILKISRAISTDERLVPGIYGNTLRLYDLVARGEPKQAALPQICNYGSVFCVLDDKRILCMGGLPCAKNAYFFDLANNAVPPTQNMLTGRSHHGVLRHIDFVYVFGGCVQPSGCLDECEKFDLITESWISLGRMQIKKHAFNPCLLEGEIYLPHLVSGQLMETFNIKTEKFNQLSVQFPLSGYSVAILLENEIFMISSNRQIGRWTIKPAETSFRVVVGNYQGGGCPSSSPPVRIGREIFWTEYSSGKLNSLDLDTNIIASR